MFTKRLAASQTFPRAAESSGRLLSVARVGRFGPRTAANERNDGRTPVDLRCHIGDTAVRATQRRHPATHEHFRLSLTLRAGEFPAKEQYPHREQPIGDSKGKQRDVAPPRSVAPIEVGTRKPAAPTAAQSSGTFGPNTNTTLNIARAISRLLRSSARSSGYRRS
jgi:hypothetical protein